tara:strand:+ start:4436 stop:4867 length:432 start_codon:yes stop_codon:yes gene_type:complete
MNTNNVIQLVAKSSATNAVKITKPDQQIDEIRDADTPLNFEAAQEAKQSKIDDAATYYINSSLEEIYGDTDTAFEQMLDLLAIDYEYFDNMNENEDLHIAFGYILTILRSAMAASCNFSDESTDHVNDIVQTIKENMKNDNSC